MSTIILAHGFLDRPRVFWRMRRSLQAAGFSVEAVHFTPSSGRGGLPRLAGQLADFIELHRPADGQVDLVGFSMGGIISRYYLQRLGGMDKVRRFIAISAPHHGTLTGHLALNPGARELRPGSALLNDLNRDAERLAEVRVTCLWTPYDLMIVPAKSCVLGVGEDFAFSVPIHSWMILSPAVMQKVIALLKAD